MTLKQRIHAGEALHIGVLGIGMTPEEMAEARRGQDWDVAFVDLQHAPYTEPDMLACCRVGDEMDLPILFRVEHPRATWKIGRALDFGATCVLVPLCEDPDLVAEAVRSFYYPPLGERSFGPGRALGWRSDYTPREYADWWNERGVLAIQIESVQAVLRIRELVQPGVDLVLFGANDLGFSIEATPDCPFADVAACQRHVVEQTRDLDVRVAVGDLPFGRFEAVR